MSRIDLLNAISPLPDGWSSPTVVEDTVVADGVTLHRAGLSSQAAGGTEAVGAAAELGQSPLPRAYYELLERITTQAAIEQRATSYALRTRDGSRAGECSADEAFPESDEPSSFRYSRSNGIALHGSWQEACARAFLELAERDRVLRSWFGEIVPRALAPSALRGAPVLGRYDLVGYEFPTQAGFSDDVAVAGVFGFPRDREAPLFFGYGARDSLRGAITSALREAMQLLAFLWGESIPTEVPPPSPTPMFHLERFQVHEAHALLRGWLDGAHTGLVRRSERATSSSAVSFIDLTPPWLGSDLRVAKALCAEAEPLIFGDSPRARHLPPELRAHPIA